MALAAIALGAVVVERHFTDSRYRRGPDISCSMDPAELRFLIDRAEEIYKAIKNPKMRTLAENEVYRFARASIVADRDLEAGCILKEQDIWSRRPGTGEIPAYDFDKVLGKKLNRAITKNQFLSWSFLD